MTPIKVLQQLFEVRDQVHLLHLNTTSFAEHKALNSFYEAWLDLSDKFIETYQGKYGRVEGQISISSKTGLKSVAFLTSVMVFLNSDIFTLFDKEIDSDLDNIVAEMKGLINQTMYLLTLK